MPPCKNSEEKTNFLNELKAKNLELKLPIEKASELTFFSDLLNLIEGVKGFEDSLDIERQVLLVEDS